MSIYYHCRPRLPYWINPLQYNLIQSMKALQVLAVKDALTGAFNRQGFFYKSQG